MGLDSLDKLEERISKAVAHIEKLNDVKRRLEDDNSQLREKIGRLEAELKSQRELAAKLEKQSTAISERVREKVEGLLDRIDSYEQSVP
jgi:predicted  nucleic acid-binding Zn-ribbon protein